jgi:hypothetical protein
MDPSSICSGLGVGDRVVAILESYVGTLPSFLRLPYALYILFGMILIPAVVFTGYFLVVCSLAIYALVKVLRTYWSLRA